MKKKRNKPYRPKPVNAPMIVCSQMVFWPLYSVIDQIEREGTVTTDQRGRPILQDGDGTWYDTVGAMAGLIDHCEMWSTRTGRELPLDAMRTFCKRLDYVMPIDAALLAEVKKDVAFLQRVMGVADGEAMLDIMRQVQIKVEFENQGVLK